MADHTHTNSDLPANKDRPSDDQDRALSREEALEESLEDSMDGSDAPSITQPGDNGDPVPSSGFPDKT